MNVEFIIGERYMHWIELGWETNDELGFPLGISVNLSALYLEYGANDASLVGAIIHVIEHEVIHYAIHATEPHYSDFDEEEATEMIQITLKGKVARIDIPKRNSDYLIAYC